ncbi:DUF3772 domain-containing protein [Pseudooceanicola algae]|uniref:Uncharacterized protein n=1 Tax=Pseudooceanicola algae TaxID=1537215 RepID=A0A418SEB9_9RHOB|nr:DUF3772 domain-containing protein [Pseudooceanicola algae]QPM89703.1 hypothetical protein PSAL_009280 [Pseudooceanicola algae]
MNQTATTETTAKQILPGRSAGGTAQRLLGRLSGGLAFALSLLLCLFLLAAPMAAQAQDSGTGTNALLSDADFAEWNVLAETAQETLNADVATDAELNALRAEVADWRQRFQDQRSANSTEIQTVQAQLDTLGTAPAEGEPAEAESVTEQRATLTERLDTLQTPVRQAELDYAEADSLISAIDSRLRSRQTNALLEVSSSPLIPTIWPTAMADLAKVFTTMGSNVAASWNDPTSRQTFRENLPVIAAVLAVAFLLVVRGVHWLERLANRFIGDDRSAQRWLLRFVVSLCQIIVPVAGLSLVAFAAASSTLFGLPGETLAVILPMAGLAVYLARWIGNYSFPASENEAAAEVLTANQRREGRIYTLIFGLLLGLSLLLQAAESNADWSDATHNVLNFPILVVMGLFLLRISRFIRLRARADHGEGEAGFRNQMTAFLARVVAILAVLGPSLAAIGYFRMGETMTIQTGISLELIATLVILQRLVTEVYILLTHNRDGARDALAPVLIGFLLTLLSLPLFALIWGARGTDLAELWSRFMHGFAIGDTMISPESFMILLLVFVVGYGATRAVQGALKTSVLPKTRLDIGGQNAVVSGLGYVGIFLAALVAITTAGIDLSSLAIVAGALSVGVGFGLQTIVSNFVSGIILLIERPVSEGDWIEVGGQMGFVRSISVRATRIETFDRTDVIVPNADLISGQVTNWTRGNLIGRLIVKVGVAYGSDTRHVQSVLQEIAESHPIVVMSPPPGVIFMGFGADSLDFEIRMILRDVTQVLIVQTEVNHRIAERFAEEGLEIPFAQRDVWLRNPETLQPRTAPSPSTPKAAGTQDPAAAASAITADDMEGGDPDAD